jgi:hypothetical protein
MKTAANWRAERAAGTSWKVAGCLPIQSLPLIQTAEDAERIEKTRQQTAPPLFMMKTLQHIILTRYYIPGLRTFSLSLYISRRYYLGVHIETSG